MMSSGGAGGSEGLQPPRALHALESNDHLWSERLGRQRLLQKAPNDNAADATS
jgi:hypothetical protein